MLHFSADSCSHITEGVHPVRSFFAFPTGNGLQSPFERARDSSRSGMKTAVRSKNPICTESRTDTELLTIDDKQGYHILIACWESLCLLYTNSRQTGFRPACKESFPLHRSSLPGSGRFRHTIAWAVSLSAVPLWRSYGSFRIPAAHRKDRSCIRIACFAKR